MNFVQAFLVLFILSKSTDSQDVNQPKNLRELASLVKVGSKNDDSFNEHASIYKYCTGAVCGLWGDPHIFTCDGLVYDCMAEGLFTVMTNHIVNIQSYFRHVKNVGMEHLRDRKKKDKKRAAVQSATYTTDIIIDFQSPTFKTNETVPIIQFSFPERIHLDKAVEETWAGCTKDIMLSDVLDNKKWTYQESVQACRKKCIERDECFNFYYTINEGHCYLAGRDAQMLQKPWPYSRTVGGTVDSCGRPPKVGTDWTESQKSETKMARMMPSRHIISQHVDSSRKHCPVLMRMNGELIDISDPWQRLLYGKYGADDTGTAILVAGNSIVVKHTLDSGEISEVVVEVSGDGPDKMFGCHFNLFACLPEKEEERLKEQKQGAGLFGSPDRDTTNDWMTVDGKELPIPEGKNALQEREAFDYCKNNWCVPQTDSLMTYPEGTTYDNYKCIEEDYVEFDLNDPNTNCLLNKEKIERKCEDKPPMLKHSCQMDCCFGGCGGIDETTENVKKLTPIGNGPNQVTFYNDTKGGNDHCKDNLYEATGETACPSSSVSVVKTIHKTADIPEDIPIIYGITFQDIQDDDLGQEVRFRVNNPFPDGVTDVYVRYEKKVGRYANDPSCTSLINSSPGCDNEAPEIVVGCVEYPNTPAFAIVDIYFAANHLQGKADPNTEVEQCCRPLEYSGVGVIKHSFKIQCTCPDGGNSDS